MVLPKKVNIYEVGARDGLQNETRFINTEDKINFINLLSNCGYTEIEATAFVSPKWIPQMSDSAEVMKSIIRKKGISYPVLTPNIKGLDNAINSNVDTVCVFASASETFSKRNTNSSIKESLLNAEKVTLKALNKGLRVRGYISCVLGCPYEKEVPYNDTAMIAKELSEMGCYEISLGDTVGYGTPLKVKHMIEEVASLVPIDMLAAHFHDTYGQAIANLYSSLCLGVNTIDSSVGGLGGCPYAVGAKGNVATEDVLYMLDGLKIHTGVKLDKVIEVSWFIFNHLDRMPNSRLAIVNKP